MGPEHIYFPGLEMIPGLEPVLDDNGEAVFLTTPGNCPIVICSPHSGTESSTPAGAKNFGERQDDPATTRTPNKDDDRNTLKITLGIVRTLSALGFIPHAVINLVSRKYMDLNRTWQAQEMWQDSAGTYRPGDENKSSQDFSRVDSFKTFKDTYYQKLHDTIQGITTSLNPDGWLFDVHGRGFTGGDLIVFSGYGYYARQDFVYGNPSSLHQCLQEQGFSVIPANPDPAQEVGGNGGLTTNLISGGRYGARFFNPASDPVPFNGNVIPNQPHRVHGIQFEIEGSLRHGQPDEFLESVGINIGYALFNCLLNNGLLTRNPSPQSGEPAQEWYSALG